MNQADGEIVGRASLDVLGRVPVQKRVVNTGDQNPLVPVEDVNRVIDDVGPTGLLHPGHQ
jgi:hypothetical protein